MRRLMIAALFCLALVASACGGDDDEEGTAPSAAPVDAIQVTLTDFALDPADPTIDAPGVVEIEATNDGQVEHSLEVEGPEGEAELEQSLQPGDSGTLRVDLSKAGRYEWYCPIGDHADRGMRGEIAVGGGGATDTDDTGTGTTETGTTETGTTETETETGTTETETDGESGEDSGGSGSGSGRGGGDEPETGGSGGY